MRRAACAWLPAAALLGAPAAVSALVTVGTFPLAESAEHVEAQNTMAWVLSGEEGCFDCDRTLRAIDFSDPRAPREVGSVTVPASIGLELAGPRAYLPGPSLRVVDVSDPSAPQPIPVQNYPAAADVEVVGNLAYVAASERFAVHDVSGLFSAPRIGSVDVPASRVVVEGTLAYVTGGRALRVIDVADPAAPRVLGQAPVGLFADVAAVRDGRAYVVESEPDGVRVVDVSAPAAPAELGFVERAGWGLALDGELAHLGGAELTALDLGAPGDPAELGALKASSPIQDFALVNGLCIAATARSGVLVIDLAQPSFPRELGAYAETGVLALDVEVRGTRAVVAGNGSLDVIDVADPTAPVRVGRAVLPAAALDLERRDDLAFVVDAQAMRVFRIPENGDPIELSRYRAGGRVTDLELLGGVAYLAVADGRLELVDVSQPALPRRRGRGVADVWDVELAGGFAFALELFDGVRVLDLAKPDLTRQRDFLSDFGVRVVAARGRRVFTAGLTVHGGFIHAAVPLLPPGAALPAELPLEGSPSDLEIVRERVYVSAGFSSCPGEDSLAVIDAARVVELGARCVPGAGAVDVADGRVYVAAGAAGLRILDFGPEYVADVREVALDVQPSRPGFRGGLLSNKPTEVAVLGSADFDVRSIAELALGPTQASPVRAAAFSDVNGDGFADLVTVFRLRAAGIGRDEERLCVAGARVDGTPFEGCDPPASAAPR